MIEKGLRAQLVTQSLVTGQLQIELDFRPDTPGTLIGPDNGEPEIPAIKSSLGSVRPLRGSVTSADDFFKRAMVWDASSPGNADRSTATAPAT